MHLYPLHTTFINLNSDNNLLRASMNRRNPLNGIGIIGVGSMMLPVSRAPLPTTISSS
jgi:hypothetical protein